MPAVLKNAAGFIMPNLQHCNTLEGGILYNNINMQKTTFIHFLKVGQKKCTSVANCTALSTHLFIMCCKSVAKRFY